MRSVPSTSPPRRPGWISNGILLAAGILAAILLGLAWLGFPGVLARWILAAANRGDYFVTAHDVKLNLRGGLTATDVQVYRKGVVGPPCLETRELRMLFRLLERPRAGISRIKEVSAWGGIIRPAWERGGQSGTGTVAMLTYPVVPGGEGQPARDFDVDITLQEFDVLGVWVDRIKTTLQTDHEGIRLSRLSGLVGRDLQRGAVEGMFEWRGGGHIDGRLVTAFDPHALTPVMSLVCPQAVPVMDRFSFPATPPRFDFSLEADRSKTPAIRVKGRMQASQYAYQGAGIGFANISGDYLYGGGTNRLNLEQFLVVVGGRQISGNAVFDFTAGMSSFGMVSDVDLASLLRLAGRKGHGMESWRFPGGTRVSARGHANYRAPGQSEIEAMVEGPRMECGSLWAQDYGFRFQSLGVTSLFTDVHAKIGGGSCVGSMTVAPDASGSNRVSHIKAELIYADVDEFMRLLVTNRVSRTEGKLFGNIELSGQGGLEGMRRVAGSGQITLRKARIFRSPLFSGLVAELGRQKPDTDWRMIPVDMRATFTVQDGRAESNDIRIENGVIGLLAKGRCGRDGSLDFTVQVQVGRDHGFFGKAMRALGSVDKPVEFAVGGTLEAPQWSVVKP